MALFNNLPTKIHETPNADTKNYIYYKVYSSVDATININGTSVPMKVGTVLDIGINKIGSVSGIYVMGSPADTGQGGQNLSRR